MAPGNSSISDRVINGTMFPRAMGTVAPEINTFPAGNGELCGTIDRGNGPKPMYSRRRPRESLGRRIGELRGTVILYGCGLGHEIDMLISMPQVSRIFVWEPHRELFTLALQNMPKSIPSNPQVHWFIGGSTLEVLSAMDKHLIPRLDMNSNLLYQNGYGPDENFRALSAHFNYLASGPWLNDGATQKRFAKPWLRNWLKNLRSKEKPSPHGFYSDLSSHGMVIGAGPSVDQWSNEIHDHGGDYIVCDTALPHLALLPTNARVIVLTIDPQFHSKGHFTGMAHHMERFDDAVTIMADTTAIDLSSQVPMARWLPVDGEHPLSFLPNPLKAMTELRTSLGNVGAVALQWAIDNYKEVTAVGLDFGYPGGKSYGTSTTMAAQSIRRWCRTSTGLQWQHPVILNSQSFIDPDSEYLSYSTPLMKSYLHGFELSPGMARKLSWYHHGRKIASKELQIRSESKEYRQYPSPEPISTDSQLELLLSYSHSILCSDMPQQTIETSLNDSNVSIRACAHLLLSLSWEQDDLNDGLVEAGKMVTRFCHQYFNSSHS